MIIGSLSLLVKFQNLLDLNSIYKTLNLTRIEANSNAANTASILTGVKGELNHTKETIEQAIQETKNARIAAQEAAETNKTVIRLLRDLKNDNQGPQNVISPTYAAIAARNILANSIYNTQSHRPTPA
jgi:hypothetical protein